MDALYAPRRTVLDAILVDAAEEAGARFRFGLTVTDLARDRGGRGRRCGRLRDHRGRDLDERADLVVGADGRGSVVAERVAAPTIAAGHHGAAYAYGYWPAADLDGYHWYYGDGLSAGVIPTNDGLACVFVGGPPAVLAAALRHARPSAAQRAAAGAASTASSPTSSAAPPVGAGAVLPRDAGAAASSVRSRAGRWSATPAGGRTRSPRTGSPTRCATRSCSPARSSPGAASERAAGSRSAGYQAQRDRIALPMHPHRRPPRLPRRGTPPRPAGCCAGCPR